MTAFHFVFSFFSIINVSEDEKTTTLEGEYDTAHKKRTELKEELSQAVDSEDKKLQSKIRNELSLVTKRWQALRKKIKAIG